jgi:hypothetical protein
MSLPRAEAEWVNRTVILSGCEGSPTGSYDTPGTLNNPSFDCEIPPIGRNDKAAEHPDIVSPTFAQLPPRLLPLPPGED